MIKILCSSLIKLHSLNHSIIIKQKEDKKMETIQEKKTSKKALVGLILGGISFGEIVLSILLYTSVFSAINNAESVAEAFTGALASVVLLAIWLFLNAISLITGIVSLILSISSLKKSPSGKKSCEITGIILSSLSIVISILLFLILIFKV